jgi:divalent metal cation (Fe/Co/Zn/Cd) transporter
MLAKIWFLDALGGLFLSIYIMWNWGQTASEHVSHLTGAAASPEDQSVLLYMTIRFSRLIQKIQGVTAYYAGDKLNVEVDIVLDEDTSLRDSHDLGESLQYMLESVPTVDRAFVHLDYKPWNLPTHMSQQE